MDRIPLYTCACCMEIFLYRMATVSKDGTWKFWDIDGEKRVNLVISKEHV